MDRAETGRRGEQAAARYYLDRGYTLKTHNYRTRLGELDLVLLSPEGELILCEVKTRSAGALARPAAAVSPAKQARLIRAAQQYLQETGQSDMPVRFDVLQNFNEGAERRRIDEFEPRTFERDVARGAVVSGENFGAELFGIARIDRPRKGDADFGRGG